MAARDMVLLLPSLGGVRHWCALQGGVPADLEVHHRFQRACKSPTVFIGRGAGEGSTAVPIWYISREVPQHSGGGHRQIPGTPRFCLTCAVLAALDPCVFYCWGNDNTVDTAIAIDISIFCRLDTR